MQSSSEKFCLRWNDFEVNVSHGLKDIRDQKDFFDVTLACDSTEQIQAHKVVLSACSPFFRDILRRNPHQHPLLYLRGIKPADLESVVNFIYYGEVQLAQEELNSFLTVAEELRIKGLSQDHSINREKNGLRPTLHPLRNGESDIDTSLGSMKRSRENSREGNGDSARAKRSKPLPHPNLRHKPNTENDVEEVVVPVKSEMIELFNREGIEEDVGEEEEEEEDEGGEYVEGDRSRSHPPASNYLRNVSSRILDGKQDNDIGFRDSDRENYGFERFDENVRPSKVLDSQNNTDLEISKDYSDFLEEAMKTNCTKIDGGYSCRLCDKVCRDLTRARQHLEAKHFPSVGYKCQICDKHCKTKHALTCHMSVYHRDFSSP